MEKRQRLRRNLREKTNAKNTHQFIETHVVGGSAKTDKHRLGRFAPFVIFYQLALFPGEVNDEFNTSIWHHGLHKLIFRIQVEISGPIRLHQAAQRQ